MYTKKQIMNDNGIDGNGGSGDLASETQKIKENFAVVDEI